MQGRELHNKQEQNHQANLMNDYYVDNKKQSCQTIHHTQPYVPPRLYTHSYIHIYDLN